MSQTNEVDTLEQENIQNTDTELGGSDNDTKPDTSTDTDITPDNDAVPDESLEEDRLTKEQLDAMSDEEFTKFMEEGK